MPKSDQGQFLERYTLKSVLESIKQELQEKPKEDRNAGYNHIKKTRRT